MESRAQCSQTLQEKHQQQQQQQQQQQMYIVAFHLSGWFGFVMS